MTPDSRLEKGIQCLSGFLSVTLATQKPWCWRDRRGDSRETGDVPGAWLFLPPAVGSSQPGVRHVGEHLQVTIAPSL